MNKTNKMSKMNGRLLKRLRNKANNMFCILNLYNRYLIYKGTKLVKEVDNFKEANYYISELKRNYIQLKVNKMKKKYAI